MILSKGTTLPYLYDYKDGKIKQGLKIGCEFDNWYNYKQGSLDGIVGHDNVGKTFFSTWIQLVLSVQHGIKWCIWSGENKPGQLVRDMVQMLAGTSFLDLGHDQIRMYSNYIEQYFEFVDNKKLYKPSELLKIFENSDADACWIDPYTGLDRSMGYADNYHFLNECRHFCNVTNKTLYINTHPVTESGRISNQYPKGHEWEGMLKAPRKADIEGGKPFSNRLDQILVCHRLTSHKEMRFYTMVTVEKVRDKETGGQQTFHEEPILFEYNFGNGFRCNGVDPLEKYRNIKNQKTIWKN